MRILTCPASRQQGSTLVTTVIFSGILGVTTLAMVELSAFRARTEYARWTSNQAYYHAENVLNWAVQTIADAAVGGNAASFLGAYSAGSGSIGLPYLADLTASGQSEFKNAWVTIANHTNGVQNLYVVTVSSKVGSKVRTIQATVRKNPPGAVFDHSYFLNNWGWWWGSGITGYGDNRANWDFDFRYNPAVNGAVVANGSIECNRVKVDPLAGSPPFTGLAGSDPVAYVHSGVPRVPMPNLKDFTYYQQKATNAGGKLWVGSTLIVDAVHYNTNQPGVYLQGTPTNPVKINGPVVVPGDVIISGPITGVGTLYVGGSLYVAGDTTYANGPSFSTPPSMLSQADRDAWVSAASAAGRDLVSFAVRGSIFGGNPNSTDWKTQCYDAASYGLKYVGDESNLGPDGIAGTPDDGLFFRDTNGDGIPDSAWYDADGNGVMDGNFNYTNQIQMTSSRASKIYRYPTNLSGVVVYDSISTNYMNRLDGVYYSNHALAMRMSKNNTVVNGSIICRNEAMVCSGTIKFVHDPRVHSRYSTDANRFIDLGLPVAQKVRIESVDEIVPVEGYYAYGQ